jgi:hypothetical protein
MPKRLVKKGVTVVREGASRPSEIGKNFDFTLKRSSGSRKSIRSLWRRPIGADDGDADASTTAEDDHDDRQAGNVRPRQEVERRAGSQAAAKGGAKKATANESTPRPRRLATRASRSGAGEVADDDL